MVGRAYGNAFCSVKSDAEVPRSMFDYSSQRCLCLENSTLDYRVEGLTAGHTKSSTKHTSCLAHIDGN